MRRMTMSRVVVDILASLLPHFRSPSVSNPGSAPWPGPRSSRTTAFGRRVESLNAVGPEVCRADAVDLPDPGRGAGIHPRCRRRVRGARRPSLPVLDRRRVRRDRDPLPHPLAADLAILPFRPGCLTPIPSRGRAAGWGARASGGGRRIPRRENARGPRAARSRTPRR